MERSIQAIEVDRSLVGIDENLEMGNPLLASYHVILYI